MMTGGESYSYIFLISLLLAVPVRMALRTLLTMNERIIVPVLRIRDPSGECRAITYIRGVVTAKPETRPLPYGPLVPLKFTQTGRNA
ncbi:hypothetical protein W02_00120 [Nitrospira sp. KM1]|uniref:hypothetical protein n=1 Tax=Nitrospira sp. KM1 TaxID=1936990 RepID=UPI0013A70E9A|nr:hypothetical protein [Nitrospira sp. KM1]BCA52872.1 hypothetical protein W02_00120 [Nitrospira sp. KM1]